MARASILAGVALLALAAPLPAAAHHRSPLAGLADPDQPPHAPPPRHGHRHPAAATPPQAPSQRLPMAPARELAYTVHSGTWTSLDVAPDGQTILFDMLGHLFAMPAAGGTARQLSFGLGFDSQPTFSPDGRFIAFVSDRSGADNLWVARADGSQPRQITRNDDDTAFVSPAWSADGQALIVSRYRADYNHVELWRIGLDGASQLIVPVRNGPDSHRPDWQSSLGATVSPDGRHVYFARHTGGLNYDEQDSWSILRRDLATGEEVAVVAPPAGRSAKHYTYFRPQLSPDGTQLAYITRTDGGNELRLRNLADGTDRLIATRLDPDALEAAIWLDIAPRYAFTPDGKAIILARGGQILRIALDQPAAPTPLPFTAAMRVAVGPSTRQTLRESDGPVNARLIQAPAVSPDGRQVAFMALGRLYVAAVAPGATPRLLATGADPVAQPAWSPDGRQIAFVSWNEAAGGQLWRMTADGSAPPLRVSALPAYYTTPVFTPDGSGLLVLRSAAAARQKAVFEFGNARPDELLRFALADVDPQAGKVIARGNFGGRPHFAGDPGEVLLLDGRGLTGVRLADGARRPLAEVLGPGYYFEDGDVPVSDILLSPDRRWLLVQSVEQAYLLPMPQGGKPGPAHLDITEPAAHALRLTREGADYLQWAGSDIVWSLGSSLFRLGADKAAAGLTTPDLVLPLPVSAARAVPQGTLVLRGGRVLTMAHGDAVIERADIVITGNRIAAIGPEGSLPIPAGATLRDVSGKTILPGFVDEHDHIGEVRRGLLSTDDWGLKARLAYGVTTSFDPSTLSIDMLSYQDMLDAGLMLGPRLRSTGPAIFSMERITSLDDARAVLARYRDFYRLGNIKEYRTGNRRVREWLAMATREAGLQPTTEGALSLKLDLSQIIDGYANNEHALAAVPLGEDVIGLLAAMHTGYSATLSVTNSGPPAGEWFGAVEDPASDAKLRHFWPQSAIEAKLDAHDWIPLRRFAFPAIAGEVAKAAAGGAVVGMGAHGEVPGIGFHWEMEAHQLGGMAPMAILHAATAGSAEVIGRLADLGTLEPGKLADLVVLDEDPRGDVRKARSLALVMRGGTLYRAETLDELWPAAQPAAPASFPAHRPGETEHWLGAP